MVLASVRLAFAFVLVGSSLHAQQSGTAAPAAPTLPKLQTSIVVLGTPEPVAADASARATVTLDMQEQPLAFQDVEDYLRTDASVDIEQRGGAGTQADISLRGTSFEQTLVLLNGLRINDVETSHFNLDVPIPLEALGSASVLHGAGSTLYGSDAIGGVVDFVTVRPAASSLKVRAGGGSFGGNEQGFVASYAGSKLSEVLAGAREHSDGFIADRDYLTESASSETRVTTALGETDVLLAGSSRPFGADQFYGPYNSFEWTKGWLAALSQGLGRKMSVAVAYRRHSDIFVLFRDRPAVYKNQHIDENWEGALRRQDALGKYATVYAGLEADTDQIQSNNLGHHGRNRGAGYVDVELRAPGKGTASLGAREEIFSGGRAVFSPQAAGSWWPHDAVKVRGSVGYGFRLPTYTDLYYTDPTHIADSGLKPESAWNFEGGLDWYPGGKAAVALTVFHSRQKDAIDYVRASSSAPFQASNLTGLHFTGVESSVTWRPSSRQSVQVGWTLLFGAQDALHGLQSDYVSNYPTNNASVAFAQTLTHGVTARSRLGVTQRFGKDPYAVWDVAVTRDSGWLRPYFRLANASDTQYQEINNVPMPGRSVTGGIEFVLKRRTH